MDYGLGFIAGLSLCLICLAPFCVFRVSEGHASVLASFGRALMQGSLGLKTFGPGLYLKWPWQKALTVSVMERVLDLSGKEGGTQAVTADGTLLRFDSKLRYKIQKSDLYAYLFALKNPVEHIKGLFTCLLRNEIANFRGERRGAVAFPNDGGLMLRQGLQATSYAVIRSERKRLNETIQDFCRTQIDGRYGVQFDAVDLTDICPPDELGDALNAVFAAQMVAEAHLAKAEGECHQRLLAAERGIEIAKLHARASEIELNEAGGYLHELKQVGTLENYVERRRTEVLSESRAVFVRSPS